MNIIVRYSCLPCGVFRRNLEVPARQDEDIKAWVDATVTRIVEAHRRECPFCQAHDLGELMIPVTGTTKIGGPVEH